MPPNKVVPEEAVGGGAAAAADDGKQLRAPLLKRLQEIDHTIKHMVAPDNLDGYKTLPLHSAARRGDMREVAQLLPTHRDSLHLRDESGWMPLRD